MGKVGLAWDLDCTQQIRIEAKMQETRNYIIDRRKQKLCLLQDKIDQLAQRVYAKLNELEDSSMSIKTHLKKSFIDIQESLKKLAEQLHSSVQLTENSSEKLLKIASKKIKDSEIAIYNLYNELDRKYIAN
jgi:stearoyl-CoA desaturase (delta-9 desaturase)